MSDEEKTITQDDNDSKLDSATPSEEKVQDKNISEETNNEESVESVVDVAAEETNNEESVESVVDAAAEDLVDYLSDEILNVPEFDGKKHVGTDKKSEID